MQQVAKKPQETAAEMWLRARGLEPLEMNDMFARMRMHFPDSRKTSREEYHKAIHERAMRDIYEITTRDEFIFTFGFSVLTGSMVEALRPYAPFIEVGSGTGYWAYELRRAGINVVATDKYPPASGRNPWFKTQWCRVKEMTASRAVKDFPDRNLLLSWPTLSHPWAARALTRFTGRYVVYEGEGHGGATADDTFHEMLEERFVEEQHIKVPVFFGLHDRLSIWRRKE